MPEKINRQTIINIVIGAICWVVLFFASLDNFIYITQIHLLILFGVAILAPLSFRQAVAVAPDDTLILPAKVALYLQPIVAIFSTASFLIPTGILSGICAGMWLVQTGLFALIGAAQFWTRSRRPLEELCVDAGLVYSSVSGIWLVAYCLSGEFFGFSGVLVPLTAAHFAVISLGALIIAGLTGRQLRQAGDLSRVYRLIAWVSIISPMLVAIGITLTNLLGSVSPVEVIGVVLLGVSFVGLGGLYLFRVRHLVGDHRAKFILALSSITLFLTMALALGYSLGRFLDMPFLSIPAMVQWHGWFNAFGFAGLGLLGWNMVSPSVYSSA